MGFFAARLVVATIDVLAGLGWGFAIKDVRGSALFATFAVLFWAFSVLIDRLLMSFVRHNYGPDPDEPQ